MSRVYVFDITLSRHLEETKESTSQQLTDELNQIAKKWVFQGELSAPTEAHPEGFKHWQIRVSLIKKCREPEMWALMKRCELLSHAHASITNSLVAKAFAGSNNEAFYVMKLDSRIDGEGPYSDKEKPLFIQREVRELIEKGLRPWQQEVVDSKDKYDSRTINVIVDAKRGVGKSSLVAFLRQKRLAVCPPSIMHDAQDYMGCVLEQQKLGMYVFDIPRAVPKKNMNAIFTAIESIKDGYAFDKRYKFRDVTFERPAIWVFSNMPPPLECLSADRWKLWTVDLTGVLIPYCSEEVQFIAPRGCASAAGRLSADSMLLGDRPSKRMRYE